MKIMITGGTGSLGRALVRSIHADPDVTRCVIYSRDEFKQAELEREFDDRRLKFYIGDVRDRYAFQMAMEGCDTVILAHALKRIPQIERNPTEALKTNVGGVQNGIEAAMRTKTVRRVLLISTDKAVEPINAYGFTKGLAERLIVSANFYRGPREIAFSALRYGNVMDSRGSVFWTWADAAASHQKIHVTDPRMTRFHMMLKGGVSLVWRSLEWMRGGEIFAPVGLRSYDMGLFTAAFLQLFHFDEGDIVGIRPGEKLHETLVTSDELMRASASDTHYEIYPPKELRDKFGIYQAFEDSELIADPVTSSTAKRVALEELVSDMQSALKRGPM